MGSPVVRARLNDAQKRLFNSSLSFYGGNNLLSSKFQAMSIGQTIKGTRFNNAKYMELPDSYNGYGRWKTKGKLKTKSKWIAAYGNNEVIVLKDIREWVLQLNIAAHQLAISAEHYRFVLAQRALKIFQDSFTLKRFNSAGYNKWPAISSWTVEKRRYGGAWPRKHRAGRPKGKWAQLRKKSTWPGAGGLMQETNALYKSMKYVPSMGANSSGIKAFARYAGVHNNPDSDTTYGNGWGGVFSPPKKAKTRKFMGHSTLMDDFIKIYEKRYLFDTVFRAPSGK